MVELIPPPFRYKDHHVQLSFTFARPLGYYGTATVTKAGIETDLKTPESYTNPDEAMRRAETMARKWIEEQSSVDEPR